MKPHNIFVSDAGQFQISDFGCAVKYGDDALISRRGTFIYSAPDTNHQLKCATHILIAIP